MLDGVDNKNVVGSDCDCMGPLPNPWSGQAVFFNSVSDIPGDGVEVAAFIETSFDLSIPPRIFGWDRIKQPAVGHFEVWAKDTTGAERHDNSGQGTMHCESIGALALTGKPWVALTPSEPTSYDAS